jgi:tyrosyl-tRNA synthetase
MDLIADLGARGLIHVSTDADALRVRLAEGPIGLYYGCDPTSDSLHVGNLIGLVTLRRFQDAGHTPIALAGGATGMVGDPSGRSEERNLLDDETLSRNVASIKEQIGRVVDLTEGRGRLVDNRDWTEPISLLGFLRDVGKFATVNQMIGRESVKNRLESEHGISYTEFSYMLLQANDYLWLHDHLGCVLQIGGSDQWGNIVSGVDLIRRARGASVHALAWPLLLAPDGSKLGKTTGARIWLDASKTSPYQFHQHFVNLSDAEVAQQLPMFSLRPLGEVERLLAEHLDAPEQRAAQRALADEVTALVHGTAAAEAAKGAGDVLFGGDPTGAPINVLEALAHEVPASTIGNNQLDDPVDLLVATSLASSRSDARRLLEQRSTRANGIQLDVDARLGDVPLLHGRFLLLRKGKHTYHLVEISPTRG